MNRRDFLKITAVFAASPVLPAILPAVVPNPPEEERGASRLGHSAAVRNAMLDTIAARAAFLAICEAGTDEIIGITPITGFRPAVGGAIYLSHLSIEFRGPCTLGHMKILDVDEVEILSADVNWTRASAIAGEMAHIGGLLFA